MAGGVGVGSMSGSSWAYKLDGDGNAILGNTDGDTVQITGTLSVKGGVVFNEGSADKDFRVESNNNANMLVVDAGNDRVGIGTGTPAETLHVAGNLEVSGNDPRIKINGVTDSHPGLEFYENGTRKWIIFNNYGDDSLDFKTNSTTRMVINQAGTVGIGTQSPDEKLDVRGNLQLYGDAPELTVRRDNNDDASTFQFQGSGGVVGAYIKFLGDESSAGGTNNDLALGTGASVAERIRITGDGKVGIGTTSPDYTLDVAGNVGVDEFIYHNGDDDTFIKFIDDTIILKASGSSMLRADPDLGQVIVNNGTIDLDFVVRSDDGSTILHTDAGNNRVGIGTDSPDYTLDVAGDIGVDQYIYHNGDADTYIKFGNDNINLKVGNRTLVTAEIKSSSPHEVTINDGGNNVDFVVKGNGSNKGNPLFKCDASTGRVGINGVGSPSVELDVDGSANISGQFARGVASVNLGSGTTSTLNPATSGAGTLLVTASSITTPTGGAANEGMHVCSLADGTIAGQVLTIIIVSNFLTGAGGASDMGVLLITPNTPLNSSTGIVTFTGSAMGGNPQGSTAVLMWTGSAWAVLSTRRGGGSA